MAKADGGRLTTHVLDTASGLPAAGLKIDLYRCPATSHRMLKEAVTNADGRCDAPLLEGPSFADRRVRARLLRPATICAAQGVALPEPAFLDTIPIRFGMAEARHYHVPLLVSPYGYSTYRGS